MSAFERNMLSYFTAFTDAFLEGRDHDNDADMLRSVMIHVSTHAVRSRSVQ